MKLQGMDPEADNYQEYYTDPGVCWFLGCMNPTAINYDPNGHILNLTRVFLRNLNLIGVM